MRSQGVQGVPQDKLFLLISVASAASVLWERNQNSSHFFLGQTTLLQRLDSGLILAQDQISTLVFVVWPMDLNTD